MQGRELKILRLNFAKTIWWWQFGCSDEKMPERITKLGWDVKIKSMEEAELLKICAAFLIIWLLRSYHINLRPFESCYIVLVPTLHSPIKIT